MVHLTLLVLALVLLATLLALLALLAAAVMVLLATRASDTFSAGLEGAMLRYNLSGSEKGMLDDLQFELQCCGADTFRDWFYISWFDQEFGGPQPNQDGFVSDDVPYSCCKVDILEPCIHHSILSINPVYRYDPHHDISVSTEGCVAALGHHVRSSALRRVELLVAFGLLQLTGAVLARLVHTAVQSAQDVRALRKPLSGRALRRQLRRVVVHSWLLGCKPLQPPRKLRRAQADGETDGDSDDSLSERGDSPEEWDEGA